METLRGEYPNHTRAKELLKSQGFTPASVLVVACDVVTNGGCFTWEFESIFDTLEEEDCLPDDKSRDRLLAGLASLNNPMFLWDAGAFMTLAQTFNGELAIPEIWEPLSPGSLCLCLQEINALYKLYKGANNLAPLYNEEPKIFMAGCCKESGLAQLPTDLSLCSEQFERLHDVKQDLAEEVSNTVQDKKAEEIAYYIQAQGKLRSKLLSELKEKGGTPG